MSHVVILGVTGSVAAYRAADLARDLMREGMTVRVCLTRSATEFVTPQLFEALTGQPALVGAFDEPIPGRMAHIDWAREASAIVVAPATANAIATIAQGRADDMLTSIIAASDASLVIAPAMNPSMYASEANIANLNVLRDRGWTVVEPVEGDVACGENGQGKLASNSAIVQAVLQNVQRSERLKGKRIVVTAGPTYEPIDEVRFIGNRSSGKMGYALARAAIQMGAEVTLISGPSYETAHPKALFVPVKTAAEMRQKVLEQAGHADLLISAAAVADFRASKPKQGKLERKEALTLELEPTEDILAEVHERFPQLPLVGFAAEIGLDQARAQEKLKRKGLIAIILNDVSDTTIGFDSTQNEGLLLTADGKTIPLNRASKYSLSLTILDAIAKLLH